MYYETCPTKNISNTGLFTTCSTRNSVIVDIDILTVALSFSTSSAFCCLSSSVTLL